MAEVIRLALRVEEPVRLRLQAAPVVAIVPEAFFAEPLFVGSEAFKLVSGDKMRLDRSVTYGEGERYSSVHAGAIGELWITDDYLYLCVKAGAAGSAVWKKAPLFLSS